MYISVFFPCISLHFLSFPIQCISLCYILNFYVLASKLSGLISILNFFGTKENPTPAITLWSEASFLRLVDNRIEEAWKIM